MLLIAPASGASLAAGECEVSLPANAVASIGLIYFSASVVVKYIYII